VSAIVLKAHRQRHLPALAVSPEIFGIRFASHCDTRNCKAVCCADGTTVDVTERDAILAHADAVKAVMTPGQDTDTTHWFEDREVDDRDFPSGRASYTMADENGCVFLDSQRRCVLQVASEKSGGAMKLKPFFCTAFPIVIDGGVLSVDPLSNTVGTTDCCSEDPSGPRTVLDVCAMELDHVLGAEGVEELRKLAEGAAKGG